MITLKFRKQTYRVERDSNCFILSRLIGDEYGEHRYYKDSFYLLKALVERHVLSKKDAQSIKDEVTNTCNDLKKSIDKAVKALDIADDVDYN